MIRFDRWQHATVSDHGSQPCVFRVASVEADHTRASKFIQRPAACTVAAVSLKTRRLFRRLAPWVTGQNAIPRRSHQPQVLISFFCVVVNQPDVVMNDKAGW